MPNETWHLDFGRLVRGGGPRWTKHVREMTRPYIINGTDLIWAAEEGGSEGQVIQLNKNLLASGGYLITAALNRRDPMAEYTLSQLILRYESTTLQVLTVEASGDGGVTWTAPFAESSAKSTVKSLLRVSYGFNVTGGDLRIKIHLPDTALARIHSARAYIIHRGRPRGD